MSSLLLQLVAFHTLCYLVELFRDRVAVLRTSYSWYSWSTLECGLVVVV